MPTLFEYFTNDFKDLSFDSDLGIQSLNKKDGSSSELFKIKRRVRQDMNSSTRLFTYYIPEFDQTDIIIASIIENIEEHKKDSDGVEVIGAFNEDINIGNHKSQYSNRIYVYCETQPSELQIQKLNNFCSTKGLYVTIRSQNYLKKKMEIEKPLAFISHDSRDKEEIARPIAMGLSSRLCYTWYDEYSLKVGNSLRESIEKGIKEAKKCVLILTRNFITNPGWTKKEFNSIFTREMIFNERIVLPVWYDISKEEVYDYSPSLADTVALKWPSPLDMNEELYKQETQKVISNLHTAITR